MNILILFTYEFIVYNFNLVNIKIFLKFKINMKKKCSKCKVKFSCQSENISSCWCTKINISQQKIKILKKNYSDCLCVRCLKNFLDKG